MMTEGPLLKVNKLTLDYNQAGKRMRALDRVSFTLEKGEVLGVAGESGCGKSTLGLSIIGLLPKSAEIRRGEILFEDQDLLKLSDQKMDECIRGRKISMIFQNPANALNPVFKIQTQMTDILRYQSRRCNPGKSRSGKSLTQQAIEQLKATGIADPAERISCYPFEFSGGMKQRVMIAMALSSDTSLLIADEPTTALDVTIEAQILSLLTDLAGQFNTSILYISHDLGVLSEIADQIMIMYAGRVFEQGNTAAVFGSPRHPYSAALLESMPSCHERGARLLTIPGYVPPLDQLPSGCTFHPRCHFAEEQCRREIPPLVEVSPGHWSACVLDPKRGEKKWKRI